MQLKKKLSQLRKEKRNLAAGKSVDTHTYTPLSRREEYVHTLEMQVFSSSLKYLIILSKYI